MTIYSGFRTSLTPKQQRRGVRNIIAPDHPGMHAGPGVRSLGLRRLNRLLIPWLRLRLLHFLAIEGDFRLGSEAPVVRVFDDLADLYVLQGEVERILGARVGGEPVLTVNLFAVGGELGKQVLVVLPLVDVGYGLTISLHDLKIAIVHPDSSREIAPVFHDLLRANVEYVGVQFILLLLTDV